MELYAFSHVKNFQKLKNISSRKNVVVGWDPRDPSGIFTEAVIRGVLKAGADTLIIGRVPTPLVPLFMLHHSADSGIMITASHNPNDQNGVKLFSPFHGMKPLPLDDLKLTRTILDQNFSSIKNAALKGKRKDCRKNALELFSRFTLAPENSWMDESINLKKVALVVDPANGSFSGLAEKLFRQAGFQKVIEVNGKLDGDVNVHSGVADLEGCHRITADQIKKPAGHFHRHKAVIKLFEKGRQHKSAIRNGEMRAAGAIFDADGDRFFRLEYDPFKDQLWVLSGDETAILQARHLINLFPKKYKGSLYINTVESDLNAAAAAEKMGLKPALTAVGDKWILLKIRLKQLQQIAKNPNLPKQKRMAFLREMKILNKSGITQISSLQKLEKILDGERVSAKNKRNAISTHPVLAVGSEETGHNITEAEWTLAHEEAVSIYSGNGLKSALNTFAATEYLAQTLTPAKYYNVLSRPFAPGFKGIFYVYYIHQDLFFNNSPVWKKVKQALVKAAKKKNYTTSIRIFPEDSDMLYISLSGGKAGIFVRNSGTENKISINLRGSKSDAAKLKQIGLEAVKILFTALKDDDHHFYKLELHALSQVASRPVTEKDLEIDKHCRTRLVTEMQKQGLIQMSPKGYRMTPLGKWYIEN